MFHLQEFIVSCEQFVGAPAGAKQVLDLMRSVVGDADGIKSAGSNTLGLHVYGGDVLAAKRSMWHPRTREELPYDVRQMFK